MGRNKRTKRLKPAPQSGVDDDSEFDGHNSVVDSFDDPELAQGARDDRDGLDISLSDKTPAKKLVIRFRAIQTRTSDINDTTTSMQAINSPGSHSPEELEPIDLSTPPQQSNNLPQWRSPDEHQILDYGAEEGAEEMDDPEAADEMEQLGGLGCTGSHEVRSRQSRHPLAHHLEEMEANEDSDDEHNIDNINPRLSTSLTAGQAQSKRPSPSRSLSPTPKRRQQGSKGNASPPPLTPSQPPKRGRGRPRKSLAPLDDKRTIAFALYIEAEGAMTLLKGKTERGNKMVKGPSEMLGPATVTTDMSWKDILATVAHESHTKMDNLAVPSFTWRWSTKAASTRLPLTNEAGYTVMVSQLRAAVVRDPDLSPTICLVMARPRPTRSSLPSWARDTAEPDDNVDLPDVSTHPKQEPEDQTRPLLAAKNQMDIAIEPKKRSLLAAHLIGSCTTHPLKRCWAYKKNNWHFELTDSRLKMWAAGIVRGRATVEEPPIGSSGFTEKDTIKDPKGGEAAPALPPKTSSEATHNAPSPGPFSQYSGWPPASPHMMNPYAQYPGPYAAMPPYPPPYMLAQPPHMASQGMPQAPRDVPPPVPSGSSGYVAGHVPSSPIPSIPVEDFCERMGLDEDDHNSLRSLGFKVGDKLSTVEPEDRKEAGIRPLQWARIVRADKNYRAEVKVAQKLNL